MIMLFSDFGAEGPYLGQMEAVLRQAAPEVPVVNLLSNAPRAEPRLAAYLLAALTKGLPPGTIFLCIVDPGVGGDRLPVVLEADGRWFVGPDNGLLNTVAVHAKQAVWRIIEWRPESLSASFHGRDLFAPVAARIASRDFTWTSGSASGPDLETWPADIATVIYFDTYGNAITGWRHTPDLDGKTLLLDGKPIRSAETFCKVPPSHPFWYCNSMGLIEIAVNLKRADTTLGLSVGMGFRFQE